MRGSDIWRVSVCLVWILLASISAAQTAVESELRAADESCQHPAEFTSPNQPFRDEPDAASISEAADMILASYDRESALLIGELHGTEETPALVALIVGRLAESQPVTLALEVSRQEQQRIDNYLQSDGCSAAVSDLLAGDFWQTAAERSDGRRSEAMVAMLASIRGYRAEGKRVRIVTLDDKDFFDADVDRRDGMARGIESLAPDLERGTVVILIGNFHARMAPFTGRLISDGVEINPIVPTASRVTSIPLTSVNVTTCSGAFWGCSNGTCGPQELTAQCPIPDGAQIYQGDPIRDGYHFTLVLEKLTASSPIVP